MRAAAIRAINTITWETSRFTVFKCNKNENLQK